MGSRPSCARCKPSSDAPPRRRLRRCCPAARRTGDVRRRQPARRHRQPRDHRRQAGHHPARVAADRRLGRQRQGISHHLPLHRNERRADRRLRCDAIPRPPPPRGKRDVVAWAHPTTGVAERCAPTLLPDLSGTIAGIEEMLDRGFVIAATDYAGLGGEGMHPYLIGVSEARAVLDSVRAARQLPDAAAGNRFAVWGHSQGGHAALFTGEQAASYAPELKLVGVAAAAPATYLGELFRADSGSIGGNTLTAMVLLSWSKIFNIPLDTVVVPGATRTFEVGRAAPASKGSPSCCGSRRSRRRCSTNSSRSTRPPSSHGGGSCRPNTPGQAPAGAPVLILQGTADELVRPQITRQFADRAVRSGRRGRDEMAGGRFARVRRI